MSVPVMALAPGRFSITKDWPSFCCMWSAISRAIMSGVEPGPNGTIDPHGLGRPVLRRGRREREQNTKQCERKPSHPRFLYRCSGTSVKPVWPPSNSGLPELPSYKRRKSGNPTCGVKPDFDRVAAA